MNKNQTTPQTVIGIDLGDKKHAVCVVNQEGVILKESTISNRPESLCKLSQEYPQARVAMEVGVHSPWISRLLQQQGLEVLVANARKLKAIYSNTRKSDRLDAQILARLARVDPQLLYPIEHGSDQAQRDLLPIKLRDNLVRQRASLITGLRSCLKSLGLRLPLSSSACFAKRARVLLEEEHPDFQAVAEPLLAAVESLSVQITLYDKLIEQSAQASYPQASRLRQITGVGPITSLSFVLSIESPQRFLKTRDVGAYLGLIPKRDQSGDSDKQMPISKEGNRYLRRLLVQSAQYILGVFGPDCDLRRHGLKIAARGGKAAKKRAVIAVARKLAVLMLTLWKEQSDYVALHSPNPSSTS